MASDREYQAGPLASCAIAGLPMTKAGPGWRSGEAWRGLRRAPRPGEGSGPGGTRPVIRVSRDAIPRSSTVAPIVPPTTFHARRKLYPSHVPIQAPEGGLTADRAALAGQTRVLSKSRLVHWRGTRSPESMPRVARALRMALDLE